jgi:hypothetical protein
MSLCGSDRKQRQGTFRPKPDVPVSTRSLESRHPFITMMLKRQALLQKSKGLHQSGGSIDWSGAAHLLTYWSSVITVAQREGRTCR